MNPSPPHRPRIVLLVENNLEILHSVAHRLEQDGYVVLKASSPLEAEQYIKSNWFHLAVFDVRLKDEQDVLDFSGATLAVDKAMGDYPRILYTSYETETAWRLMREYFGGLPNGVHIRSKREEPDPIPIIKEAFGDQPGRPGIVEINFDLHIDSMPCLVLAAKMNPELGSDAPALIARAHELEDLFARAFHKYDRLKVEELRQSQQGRSGSLILKVIPQRDGMYSAPLLVKCGLYTTIRREYDNYRNYAKEFIPASVPQIDDEKEFKTRHYGLIKYRLVGGQMDVDEVITFADFYHSQQPALITRAVENVFRSTEKWHLNSRNSSDRRMMPPYQTRFYEQRLIFRRHSNLINRVDEWSQVGQTVQRLIESPPPSLTIRPASHSRLRWQTTHIEIELPNPYSYLSKTRDRPSKLFPKDYSICICHGDLHENNVLVDERGRPWLIDFEFTDWGPVLQDAVELESVTRFRLFPDRERQLERLLLLELAVARQRTLEGPVELPEQLRGAEHSEVHRAVEVVRAIRRAASRIEAGRLPDYYLGLVYQAMLAMLNESSSTQTDPYMRRPHRTRIQALFSASLYCERLLELEATPDSLEPV